MLSRAKAGFVALAALLGAAVVGCQQDTPPESGAAVSDDGSAAAAPETSRPRLVDLGAGKCIPCKKMAPILEELKQEYAGVMDVIFIDVWENPGAAEQYGVQTIPTQIFYDASGSERFRNEGFFSKENILKKWEELGVRLERPKKG